LRKKNKGNELYKRRKFDEAVAAWAQARKILSAAGVGGHHVALLWSNTATCKKVAGDDDGCREACDEGLKEPSSKAIRNKLENMLAGKKSTPSPVSTSEDQHLPKLKSGEAVIVHGLKGAVELNGREGKLKDFVLSKERWQVAFAEDTKLLRTENLKLKVLQTGFLNHEPDLYPEGSAQGQMPQFYRQPVNGGEACVDVPINQPGRKDPMIIPMPDFPEPDSDDNV